MLRLLLTLGLFVLTSCANVPSDFKFDPGKPTGLVVGSISYESGLAKFYLVAASPSSPKPVSFAFGCSVWPCVEPADDPQFSANETPKQRGGGFAVEVPEGTYRILGWQVMKGQTVYRSKAPVPIEFVVQRGKASYIGNLHFDADWENVQLRDRAARDLPLLKGKFMALNHTELAFAIAPGAVISGIGGEYQRGFEGPIFIPILRR